MRGISIHPNVCTDLLRQEEYNRWYIHVHLPDLRKAKGMVHADRYKNLDTAALNPAMAIYEFDSPSLKESVNDMLRLAVEAFPKGRHIDCIQGSSGGTLADTTWRVVEPSEHKPPERLDYPASLPPWGPGLIHRLREQGVIQ